MKKILALVLAAVMLFALAACGAQTETAAPATEATETTEPAQTTETAELVYAVEAGSAGEEVALEKGFKVNSVDTQAKALMEVQAGTSDAAIIDLLMAGAMIGEGTSYPELKTTDELTEEKYVVGCRKGSDLAAFINNVLSKTASNGKLNSIASIYGVQAALVEQPAAAAFEPAADGDIAYIQGKGTLVVGITDFAPMDYKNDSGEWIGFDADMARIVAEELGVDIEFVEIDWDNKIFELDGKQIDVVWNGMTLTEEVGNAMECSNAYCNNAQVIVVKG